MKTEKWQIVKLDYIGLKQSYTCTIDSSNFINPHVLSSALAVLVHYSLGSSG